MIKERKINSTNYPMHFLMVDSADNITGKTGLSPTVYISKNSGSFSTASGSVVEIGYGIYALSANATDRNTIGEFILHATSASAVSEDIVYNIVNYDPFSEVSYISASVALIPTNPLLTTDVRLDNLNTTISSRASASALELIPTNTASASSVSAIPTNPLLTNDSRLDNLNTTLSSRASASAIELISTTSASTLVDLIWDEVLSGATHNVPASSGRRLRQIASTIIIDGIAVASTDNTITLDSGASTANGAYDPSTIYIVLGTGAGQCRNILEYNGSTKIAVVDRNWKVNPSTDSEYVIIGDAGREHVNEGLIRSGSSLSVQLNANASSSDGEYVGQVLFIRSGTGEDQARRIISYDGVNKIATTRKAWNPIPDTTSAYVMLPTAELDIDKFIMSMWSYGERTMTSASGLGTLASASSLDLIPTDTASASSVSAIPTNPLLTNDVRIPDMIASASLVSSISGGTSASTIWEYADRKLTSASNLDLSSVLNSTVEGTFTLKDVLSIMVAVLAGKASGGGTTTITFRDLQDTLNRIVATVDSSGNRRGVVYDTTDV